MHNAVETANLTYRYSRAEAVVREVALRVPAGSIYGFLGPNGAGKTTTLRLVTGLLRAQQGVITVLGRSLRRDRLEILRQVGSSIESPSLYGDLDVLPDDKAQMRNAPHEFPGSSAQPVKCTICSVCGGP